MTAPHLRFRHLDAAVTTATAALLEAGTGPPADAEAEFQQWADTATAAYHLPPLTIHTDTAGRDWAPAPHGYTPDATISLRGRTITALLKNFRRHMQHHGARPLGTPDNDATAWALSLYYTVRPRQLARLTADWTPTGFVDTIRSGTMVYEERTGRGTGSQEVHPGI